MWEGFGGMKVIRAFGRESYEQERFEQASKDVRTTFLKLDMLSGVVNPLSEVLSAALLLCILAIALLQDRAVFPTLLTFIFILYGLQPKVKQLDSARVGLVALTSSVDDVMSLLDCSNKPYIRSGQIPFIGLQQAISFESVTFCYNPQEKPAIQDISIRIPDIFQLVAQMPDIRYVQEPRPGLSVARNTGIRQSKGDIIAFTDDDVTVHPNWIARLQQSFPDPQVMAVTGLVLPAELETEAQFIFEKNVVQPVQELMFA
jgi:hypothetical protein